MQCKYARQGCVLFFLKKKRKLKVYIKSYSFGGFEVFNFSVPNKGSETTKPG
jgi:hypothetical protein